MSIHKFLSPLRRDRKFTSSVLTVTTFAAVNLGYVWTQSDGSQRVAKLLQVYRDNQLVVLSDSLSEMCSSCLAEAKLPAAHKEKYRFFACFGDEATYFGYASLRRLSKDACSYIGLPLYFEYNSIKDIDTQKLAVWVNNAIPWQTRNGQRLLDSLVLSEKAKKFVIMRQIYMTNTLAPNLHFANMATCFTVYWMISRVIFRAFSKTPYTSLPLGFRLLLKTVQVAFCATIFVIFRDIVRNASETQSDLRTVEHGDDYYEGAIEFYSKVLNRNKAFSFFLGDEGKHYYSPSGDPKPPLYFKYFRPISMKPSARIAAIQDRFGHYIAKDEPISN